MPSLKYWKAFSEYVALQAKRGIKKEIHEHLADFKKKMSGEK